MDSLLRDLLDKLAITDLAMLHARGMDRRDFDAVASCFTGDAEADLCGPNPLAPFPFREGGSRKRHRLSGRDKIIEAIKGMDPRVVSTHLVGSQRIDLRGDQATAEVSAIAYHRMAAPGGEADLARGLRYQNHLVLRDGRWLIRRHRVLRVGAGRTRWRRLRPRRSRR